MDWLLSTAAELQPLGMLVLLLGGAYVLGHLNRGASAYASKKGENLATKQDIEGITTKVEAIRKDYQSALNSEQHYLQDRRTALLEFYDTALLMMYEALGINFGDLPMDNGKALFEHDQRFRNLVTDLLRRYQRIVVFFDHEEELRSLSEEVLTHGLEARRKHSENFGLVKTRLIQEQPAFLSQDRAVKLRAAAAADSAVEVYRAAVDPPGQEYRAAVQRYLVALNKFLRPGEAATAPKLP